ADPCARSTRTTAVCCAGRFRRRLHGSNRIVGGRSSYHTACSDPVHAGARGSYNNFGVLMAQSRAARERLALVAIAVSVSLGYYIACQVGVSLRQPTAPPSVLWPPNAILTSALLLTAPRRWWLILLAALPAHVIVELPTGWPLALVLWLFVTNCLEAIIAAGG